MPTDRTIPDSKSWRYYVNQLIADELSTLTKYYDRVIQWMPRKEESKIILTLLKAPKKDIVYENDNFPDLSMERNQRTAVLLNGVLNHHFDIEGLLSNLWLSLSRTSRVVLIMYNPYYSWLYTLANRIGLRKGPAPTTFITRVDLENISKLTQFNIVRQRMVAYIPWRLFGIGDFLNHLLTSLPFIRWLSFTYIVVLQPIIPEKKSASPSLSCIIPARNEHDNIENALRRMPKLPCKLEIIFVEGNSTDNTWEEIQRVSKKYAKNFEIKTYQQTGHGKSDAVRLGLSKASGDLLTILDADLTMPPELLGRYYSAYCKGLADFINGSRLVYPMEGNAMRFLNRLGNIFFARILSWVLDERIGDSLCGTKLFTRHDYQRMIAWRNDFGDFDPFGDFELLFPASALGLGIIDIPIRYHARTYGDTNISRFRHGLILLKMVAIGFLKLKTRLQD